jgi:hypothetical protein
MHKQPGRTSTGPGTSWDLPHDPMPIHGIPVKVEHIPCSLHPGIPGVGGAQVLNLGQLVDRSYYVQNNMLRMDERNLVDWQRDDL